MPNTTQSLDTTEDTATIAGELPEPSRRKQEDREVRFLWDLGDDPDGGVRQVVLSIMHHKHQRAGVFSATILNQTEQHTEFGVQKRMGSITDWTRIAAKHAARYSDAQLEQFAQEALARLTVLYVQDDKEGQHARSYFTKEVKA
jgi:hypothetical protein